MQEFNYWQMIDYINQFMKYTVKFSSILLTVVLVLSLLLWLVGIKIKSEKAIKNGIRISISSAILELLLIVMVVAISRFR